MKHIEKREPPASLEEYKKLEGACFSRLPSLVKQELKQQLIDELESMRDQLDNLDRCLECLLGDLNEEDDADLSRAREKVMDILCKCDAQQLKGIEKIAAIYADGVKMK